MARGQRQARSYIEGVACRTCGGTLRYDYGKRKPCVACHRKKGMERRTGEATRLRYAYEKARWRANRDGIEFSIEPGDLTMSTVCPVLGIPFTQPSLDRHDHRKGYVKGNVVVMSWRANNLKADGSLAEFEKLVAYLTANPVVSEPPGNS